MTPTDGKHFLLDDDHPEVLNNINEAAARKTHKVQTTTHQHSNAPEILSGLGANMPHIPPGEFG